VEVPSAGLINWLAGKNGFRLPPNLSPDCSSIRRQFCVDTGRRQGYPQVSSNATRSQKDSTMKEDFAKFTLHFVCVLLVVASNAAAQTSAPTVADDGAPYGGLSLPVAAAAPGALPAENAGQACPVVGGVTPPCVLTGQYNRYRTSVNANETGLANFTSGDASSFGLTAFYQFPGHTNWPPIPSPGSGNYNFEPVVAQPLYITNLAVTGVNCTSPNCPNILLVASLYDLVYAFNTSTGAEAWTNPVNLAADCTTGVPFVNNFSHNPGGTNLPYYGVVATPVIDIYPGIPPVPTAFVVSACVSSYASDNIQWNLDAINLESGAKMGSAIINPSGFNSSYELSRASLLLTHPTSTTTDIYIAFGTGAGETQAAGTCPAGFPSCAYSGWLLLYSATYTSTPPSVSFGFVSGLATSGGTNSLVFPTVYTGFNTIGAPKGPSGLGSTETCVAPNCVWDQGDNWSVSQGGIWMSSGGPSSTASASVYAASANGPFACTSPSDSQCLIPGNVVYWGESAMKFPAANLSNPTTPTDFFAPSYQRYTLNSDGDPDPSLYQTGELSRLDLDFGSTPPVIVPLASAPEFALIGDKSGYMYVVPAEANGSGLTVSMGQFQNDDAGLGNGAVTTQPPFQASQLPIWPNTGNLVCPLNSDGSPWTNNNVSCDEIHEIAFFNNLAFVWPLNESVEAFQGTATPGTGTYRYRFDTTAVINPCPAPFTGLPTECTGVHPQFPGANAGGMVGAMAIASTPGPDPTGTLWAITPEPGEGGWGWLYAYAIDSTLPVGQRHGPGEL
jgi:hypothetical protein